MEYQGVVHLIINGRFSTLSTIISKTIYNENRCYFKRRCTRHYF